jgi:hypothetical protein
MQQKNARRERRAPAVAKFVVLNQYYKDSDLGPIWYINSISLKSLKTICLYEFLYRRIN